MKICVFLSEDYKLCEIIDVEDSLSDSQILEILDTFFDMWFFCELLFKNPEDFITDNIEDNNEIN